MAHPQYGRFQRSGLARPEKPEPAQRALADAIVRTVGAVEPPRKRQRYYAESEGGARVSVYSNAGYDDVLDQLRAKAGGDAIVHCWHNKGAPGDAALDHERRMVPVDRHRASILAASKPGEAVAAPDPLQGMVTMIQAQLALATPETLAANPTLMMMGPALALLAQQAKPVDAPAGGARISDRLKRFCTYLSQRETTRSSIDAFLYSVRLFVGVNGDLLLKDITRAHCERFIDAVTVWPRNASKRRDYRGLEVLAVLEKAKRVCEPPIDLATQQKHIDRVRGFFRWCEGQEEVRPNLLYRVRLNPKHRARARKQHRRPFTPQELGQIFSFSDPRRADTLFKFWMVPFVFYTGARVNELAQLGVDDFILIDGRWFFNIANDRPGQRLKNNASRRIVPVHPHLLKLGLLKFIAQAKKWGRERLFPDVVWGRNGPGETVSRWFADYARKTLNITDRGQTFHAFRNTFVYFASRSGLSVDEYSALTGHIVQSNVVVEIYLPQRDAAERCAIYDRIQFPSISHPAYAPALYERVFRRAHAREQRAAR